MIVDELIRSILAAALPGVELTLGKIHGAVTPKGRYAVLRPAGGVRGDVVRRPLFTLDVLGGKGGDYDETKALVEAAILALRQRHPGVVNLSPGEPSYTTSAEGRPVFSVAIAAIVETN